MNLGLFLAIGESFRDFRNKGQDQLIINLNLKNYSQNFDKVYVFSYENEELHFFNNIIVLPNKYKLHRYFYSILLPLFYIKEIKSCDVFRGLQITGAIPAILTKMLFKKRVVTNYGYNYTKVARTEGKFLQWLLYYFSEKKLINFSDVIITTSKHIYKNLSYFDKKVLIPNGVDMIRFKPFKIKKIYTVIFVGRLEKQKNIFTLINALSFLNKKYRKLLLIGNGSLKNDIEIYTREKEVDCTLMAKINHDALPNYYNQARIFILPSLAEGNPKSLLEAMSCGLPCIGNNVEGISEVIKNKKNGLLFSKSSMDLTKQILILLNNSALAKTISTNARKTIQNNYNYQILKEKEIRLLKKYVKR